MPFPRSIKNSKIVIFSLNTLSLVLILILHVSADCPEDTNELHRLRKTRFYVYQNSARNTWMSWYGAKKKCQELGLKLAKIDSIETEVLVGRALEKFMKEKGWIDNWYWLDAKFDREVKKYIWQDTMKPLNFSNFYYRDPRPKGYGDFFDINGVYQEEPKERHCLAQSIPLPFPNTVTPPEPVTHGFHTSWWERICDSQKKGNVLCESTDPECEEQQKLSVYTRKTSGYYESFWPLSNRKYVVHWNARSFDEAKALCAENKMKIFSPGKDDSCLPQNLKNWMRRTTSYSFWTDVKYKVADKKFVYPDGSEVPSTSVNMTDIASKRRRRRRKRAEAMDVCTSLTWNYEENPLNLNFCDCDFNSAVLSPENCNNPIGVICQHPDAETRKCTKEYMGSLPTPGKTFTDILKAPKYNEFVPFDGDEKGTLIRSVFKQEGKSGVCPQGRRVTSLESYWGELTAVNFEESLYPYDYTAPYWMRPEIREPPSKSTCFLSRVTYDKDEGVLNRVLTEEDCNNWTGFILCKKVDQGITSTNPDDEKSPKGRLDGGIKGLTNEPKVSMEPL